MEHFGSSAIPHIKSKPYIDILVEIPQELLFDETIIQQFEELGYTYFKVPQRDNIDAYMSFGKGYNLSGRKEQIYHVHMCPKENIMWEQIKFRDYLLTHYDRAKEYEALKISLALQFRNDRGAYVMGKNNFIAETIDLVKETNHMNAFPVTASTLSERQLGIFTIDKYSLNKNSTCKLFRTGVNHTYMISNDEIKYVLRVYSYGWRSKQEIFEEIKLLTFLKENNVSVSYPIPDKNREFIQEITAPEGKRYAVLFSYAKGGKVRFMDEATCASVGSLMAQIHNLSSSKEIERIAYNKNLLLELPYQHAKAFFSDTLPEMIFIRETCDVISKTFEQVDCERVRTGIVHMDIWYDNMSITDKKEITVFDFDFCGNGFFVLDVAYFCKQLFHIETDKHAYEQKVRSFLDGYQSVRDLSKEELALIPYAGAAVWIFYLGVQSRRFDWSNIFLTENYFKMYVGKMRDWLEYCN